MTLIRKSAAQAALLFCLAALAACSPAREATSHAEVAASAAAATIASEPAPAAAPALPVATVAPGTPAAPVNAKPSLACASDADCAVKDVGSCCGYKPMCVNKAAETFPDKVKAACKDQGRVGICGFKPVESCECVQGKCANREAPGQGLLQ